MYAVHCIAEAEDQKLSNAAAGFMFGSGLVLSEVPFDPELPFLFDGEEVGKSTSC